MSSKIEVTKNELHLPNLAPNQPKMNEYGMRSNNIKEALKEARKTFSPENESNQNIFFLIILI